MWPFRRKKKSANSDEDLLEFDQLIVELQRLPSDDSASEYRCGITLQKLVEDLYNGVGPEPIRIAHDLIPALVPLILTGHLYSSLIMTFTNLISSCEKHNEPWNSPSLETNLTKQLAKILSETKKSPSVSLSRSATNVEMICLIFGMMPELHKETISTLQELNACRPLRDYQGFDQPHIRPCLDMYVTKSQVASQIAAVEQLGGTAAIGGGLHGPAVIGVDFSRQGEAFGPSHLELLATLTELRKLDICVSLVGDEGLSFLNGLPQLQELNLHGCLVTDNGLRHVTNLPHLQRLDLSWNDITNAGLLELVKLAELKHLSLDGTKITPQGLRPLAALRQLERLDLEGFFDKPGLEELKHIASLESLNLERTELSDAELREVCLLNRLKYLNINSALITDIGFCEIAKLGSLQVLHATYIQRFDSGITEVGLKALKDLPNLLEVDLSYTSSITDEGLKWLSHSRSLKRIRIRQACISASGLKTLASLEPLRLLDLGGAWRLADECVRPLRHFTQLEFLELSGTKISESGIQDLRKALPDCYISWGEIL